MTLELFGFYAIMVQLLITLILWVYTAYKIYEDVKNDRVPTYGEVIREYALLAFPIVNVVFFWFLLEDIFKGMFAFLDKPIVNKKRKQNNE